MSNTTLQFPKRHLCDQLNGCSSAVQPEAEEEERIRHIAHDDARFWSSSSDGQREERSRQRHRRRWVIEDSKSSLHGPRRDPILRTIEEGPQRISNEQTSSSARGSDERRRRERLEVLQGRQAQFLPPLPQSYLMSLKTDGGTDDDLPVDWDVESVASAQL